LVLMCACPRSPLSLSCSFSFTPTPSTDLFTLSLHDALPISRNAIVCGSHSSGNVRQRQVRSLDAQPKLMEYNSWRPLDASRPVRSEEHTSELQSRRDLVCRLLLEKKKKIKLACCNVNRGRLS